MQNEKGEEDEPKEIQYLIAELDEEGRVLRKFDVIVKSPISDKKPVPPKSGDNPPAENDPKKLSS